MLLSPPYYPVCLSPRLSPRPRRGRADQFVRHHTGYLLGRQDAQQAAGRRHRRVFRVAPGREGVGLVVSYNIDLGHRQTGTVGKLFDRAVQPRR